LPLCRETKKTGLIFCAALKRGGRIPVARRQVFMNEILEIIYNDSANIDRPVPTPIGCGSPFDLLLEILYAS
jgi:hypothetical protein